MFSLEPTEIYCAYPVIKETIPASSLGYHSNNRYDGFPPLMNDGRSITANGRLTQKQNNSQYRSHMIKNAKQIMETDFRNASNDTGYPSGERIIPAQPNRFEPVKSDLKDIYLSREMLDLRRDPTAFPANSK